MKVLNRTVGVGAAAAVAGGPAAVVGRRATLSRPRKDQLLSREKFVRGLRLLVAAVIACLLAASGWGAPPAYAAYPTTHFDVQDWPNEGGADGNITWYNRSIQIQGAVYDYGGGPDSVTVMFIFYQGGPTGTHLGEQTRTARMGEVKSFNFVQEGPVGGITDVFILFCYYGECHYWDQLKRP